MAGLKGQGVLVSRSSCPLSAVRDNFGPPSVWSGDGKGTPCFSSQTFKSFRAIVSYHFRFRYFVGSVIFSPLTGHCDRQYVKSFRAQPAFSPSPFAVFDSHGFPALLSRRPCR